MNVSRNWLFLIFLLGRSVFAQEEAIQQEQVLRIKASVELKAVPIPEIKAFETNVNLGHVGQIEIGKLLPNQRYRMDLTLVNSIETDLIADELKAGCGCIEFHEADSFSVGGNKSAKLQLSFKTPKATVDGKFDIRFEFRHERKMTGIILMRSQLSNNLYVVPALNLECPARPMTFRVPVSITAPLDLNEVEILISDNLKDISCELAKEDDSVFLKIEVNSDSFDGDFLSGSIRLKSKANDLETETRLTFLRMSPVKISPEFLRFRSGNSEFESVFKAVALIRFADEKNDQAQVKPPRFITDLVPSIQLSSMSGLEVKGDVKKLNENIFRVTFQVKADQLDKLHATTDGILRIDFKGENFQQSISISSEN
jgi:hypothetical protein